MKLMHIPTVCSPYRVLLTACLVWYFGHADHIMSISSVVIPRSQVYSPAWWPSLDRSSKSVSVYLEYSQTFQPDHIAQAFLPSAHLNFAGSQASASPADALLADNLGLGTQYQGSLHVNPVVQNVTATIYHVMDLSRFIDRVYVTFLAPLCNTRWDLNACQTTSTPSDTLPAAYQSANATAAIGNLQDAFSYNALFGDNLRGVGYQQIDWTGARSITTLAGFLITCGRHFVYGDTARWSWFGMFNFPSSNTPDPAFLFNPIAGNGHYCEIGAGIEGWVSLLPPDHPCSLRWSAQTAAQYLIRTYQQRTFDLRDQGPLSRYMLLKQIDPATGNYTGSLLNATYATTYGVYTQRPIQGTFSTRFDICWGGWSGNIGYQLYGVAAEDVSVSVCRPTCVAFGNLYGVKGTSGAYTFTLTDGIISGTVPLNATEYNATMYRPGPIDNPVDIPNSTIWSNVVDGTVIDPSIVATASNPAWIVRASDLNISSARAPAQITQSIFAEWGYRWECSERPAADGTQPAQGATRSICPQWLVGAFIEFASPAHHGFSLWGAWSRVTVDF